MRLIITKACLLFVCFSSAQNYSVVYKLKQVSKVSRYYETNIKTYLTGNGEVSVYMEDYMKAIGNNTENSMVLVVPTDENPIYYKEFNKKKVTYIDDIKFTNFNVIDSVGDFDWIITNETKKILQYNCQKATLRFRGRNFEVFFTKDLPFSDGPIKFYGLPGLILEVFTDNNIASYHFVAESIKFTNNKSPIKNVFEKKEVISYADFVKIYRQKYQESLTKIVTANGETRPMTKGYMENYID